MQYPGAVTLINKAEYWSVSKLEHGVGKNNNVRFPVTWNYMLKQSAFCFGLSPSSCTAVSQLEESRVAHQQRRLQSDERSGRHTRSRRRRITDRDLCYSADKTETRQMCRGWIDTKFIKLFFSRRWWQWCLVRFDDCQEQEMDWSGPNGHTGLK